MKTKFRFNILDAVMILAVAAACILLVFFLSDRAQTSGKTSEILVTAELSQKSEGFAKNIKPGSVYDAVKGGYIGELVSVETVPYTVVSSSLSPEGFILTPVPGYETNIVTIKINASVTDRSTAVGNTALYVGSTLYLKSADFASTATILIMEGEPWK